MCCENDCSYFTHKNSRTLCDVKDTTNKILRIGSAMKTHDTLTWAHSRNVAKTSFIFARHLGLSAAESGVVLAAGLLHDVGKLKVPRGIIEKPGKLDDDEYTWMQKHVDYGVDMLECFKLPRSILDGVKYHHERYDGTGYVSGLKGENIPLVARIVSITDCYEALVSWRPYRDPMIPAAALKLMASSEGQFDVIIFNSFMRLAITGLLKDRTQLLLSEDCYYKQLTMAVLGR